MRQRLQPLGPMILYTTAWAPFFLIASLAPLIFPGNTPDDQNVALAFFAISWLLLFVPFSKLRDGLENRARANLLDLYPFEAGLMVLGTILFLLHVIIDPRFGGFSFAFFAYAQYRTISNITVSAGHNSARWLLPIESSDFSNLFSDIPDGVLRTGGLPLRGPQSEEEIWADAQHLLGANIDLDSRPSFLSAGLARNFVPTMVGMLDTRGEFLTSYTPYQPEVSQGYLF